MDCRLITDNPYIIGTAHESRNADVTVAEPSVDSLITSRGVGTARTQKDQQDTLARLATVCAKHRHTGTAGTHSLTPDKTPFARSKYLRTDTLRPVFYFSFF